MGLFYINGEYDTPVKVSKNLAEKILNKIYVEPSNIFSVNIYITRKDSITAYIENESFAQYGINETNSIKINFEDRNSKEYMFFKDLTIVPKKEFIFYMNKIGYADCNID